MYKICMCISMVHGTTHILMLNNNINLICTVWYRYHDAMSLEKHTCTTKTLQKFQLLRISHNR